MAASISIKTKACCFCRKASLSLTKANKLFIIRRCQGTAIIPGKTDIDPVAMEIMDRRGVTFKGHPGIMTLKSVNLPERLERAMDNVIEKYPVTELRKKSDELRNYLHSRHPPLENSELKISAKKLYDSIKEKENIDIESLEEEEREKYEARVQKQVLKKLQFKHYHWKAIGYDAKTSLTYLYGQMAPNYSITMQCFSEISRREPEYQPRTVYDLGSGLGSSVWAANKMWGASVFEYYCVDISRDMNTLARLLLQDGEEQKKMHIPGVYFRQFHPSPQQNSFSLVVCGHTLLELPNREARLESISALWKMTEDFLVLIDNGSKAGFSVINEAKEHILKLSEMGNSKMVGHVYAPCPHDSACPKLEERNSPCMFSVTYKPYLFAKKESIGKQSSRYSYVIMRKGRRKETDVQWPRIIQEVKKRSAHVHCHLCCPNATLSHEVLTKKRNGSNVYKCSRSSRWGDLFPVILPRKEEQTTDQLLDEDTSSTSQVNTVNSTTDQTDPSLKDDKTDSQQTPQNSLVL